MCPAETVVNLQIDAVVRRLVNLQIDAVVRRLVNLQIDAVASVMLATQHVSSRDCSKPTN